MDDVMLEKSDCNVNKSEDGKNENLFNFSQLPWVIFLTILEFFKTTELCRLCLVSKLWCKACRDPSLWRCIDLTRCRNVSDDDLCRLTSFSNNVLRLKICECDCLTDVGVSLAIKQCTSLVELTITNCKLSNKVLEAIGEYCQCLRKLDVSLSETFSDDGLNKVFEKCQELEEVILDQCPNVTSNCVASLGRHCPRIKSLSTQRISGIKDLGVVSVVHGCAGLKRLRVPFCGLTNECVPHIVQCCQDILLLDLRHVSLGDDDVCSLVESCRKLECLNLSLCYNLTDRAALDISRNCMSLKYLFLVHNKVTDKGLLQLGKHCKNLQRLDVSWCSAITEVGARDVLMGCPNLEHLGLVRCDNVSELAVTQLSTHFPHVFLSTVKTEMNKSQMKQNNAAPSEYK